MILDCCYPYSDLNLILIRDEMTLKHYNESCMLAAFKFSLKSLLQLFGAIIGDDSMILRHILIFFATFLLDVYVLFCFVYFVISISLGWLFL